MQRLEFCIETPLCLLHRSTSTHTHQRLLNGRAAAAAIYPPNLCKAMLRGIAEQARREGRVAPDLVLGALLRGGCVDLAALEVEAARPFVRLPQSMGEPMALAPAEGTARVIDEEDALSAARLAGVVSTTTDRPNQDGRHCPMSTTGFHSTATWRILRTSGAPMSTPGFHTTATSRHLGAPRWREVVVLCKPAVDMGAPEAPRRREVAVL